MVSTGRGGSLGVWCGSVYRVQDVDNMKWVLAHEGPALCITSGLCFYGERKPEGLHLNDVLAMIKEHPRAQQYRAELDRAVTLAEGLEMGKVEDIGTIQPHVTTIRLYNQRHARHFPKLPKTGQQLKSKHYNSLPLEVQE